MQYLHITQKKSGVATLISDIKMTSGNAPNNRVSKYIKQKPMGPKLDIAIP